MINDVTKKSAKLRLHSILRQVNDGGSDWYQTANKMLSAMAERFNISLDLVCAITAAMSPGTRWESNINDTRLFLEVYEAGELHKKVAEYGAEDGSYKPKGNKKALHSLDTPKQFTAYAMNVLKAFRIVETGNTALLNGPKITAFYHNLRGDDSHVTIDIHMANAMANTQFTVDSLPNLNITTYKRFAEAVREVAQKKNIPAASLQAKVWEYQRTKSHNNTQKRRSRA